MRGNANHRSERRSVGAVLLPWLVATFASTLAACSGEETTKKAEADSATTFDIAPFDAGDAAPEQDTGSSDCPGAAGCPCKANADCDSTLCLETPAGLRCAALCDGSGCAADEVCTEIPSGSDTIIACAARFATLCDPCNADKDCSSPGAKDSACVRWGGDGAFCGSACDDDGDCKEGYACADGISVSGKTVRQCRPKDSATCTCSPHAIGNELTTNCQVAGAGGASCPGKRVCLAAGSANAPAGGGLSACLGQAPGPEACDGTDNDCDGATDEAAEGCDDGAPCTIDTCEAGACKHTIDGTNCDDNDPCTTQDTCIQSGDVSTCKGSPLDCDDNDPCTIDSCGAKGCAHSGGPACDDGNPCTENDTCVAGLCAGVTKVCDDGNACSADSCEGATGVCLSEALTGTSCDDGDACTAGDGCSKGLSGIGCYGTQSVSCDDANACTLDSCDPAKGCTNSADLAQSFPCYDGDPGTSGVGPCVVGTASCKEDGTLGPCIGQVVPKTEVCDNQQDDDCDGQSDEGCSQGPVQVRWRVAMTRVEGSTAGTKLGFGGSNGLGGLQSSGGNAPSIGLGFYQALRALWK